MGQATLPSDVARQLAAALDDNPRLPVAEALPFELALANDPTDQAARTAYHDWLVEHDCPRRAAQLARGLWPDEMPAYDGPVRPQAGSNWAGL